MINIHNRTLNFIEKIHNPFNSTLIDLQDIITQSSFEFFHLKKLKTIHLPITTNSISSPMGLGSDSKPVKINLFNTETYLADSMQFLLEYACRLKKEGCFYLMPSFRGEINDKSHISQFYHSEAEIIGTIEDIRKFVEEYINHLNKSILENISLVDEIKKITGSVKHIEMVLNKPYFPIIEMKEVIKLFKEKCDLLKCYKNPEFHALTIKGEQELIKQFGGIVWLINYEHISTPFYQAFHPDDQKYALSSDLLFGIGETIGAGQRHANKKDVLLAIDRHEVASKDYSWYIKLKEEFPMETSGFGMGIERYLAWVFNHFDIRDFQICYRENGKIHIP